MRTANETVMFNRWKDRFRAGEDISNLALRGVMLIDGLAYGRVNIESRQGSRLELAHFAVNAECQISTAAGLHYSDPVDAVPVPEGHVVGLFGKMTQSTLENA